MFGSWGFQHCPPIVQEAPSEAVTSKACELNADQSTSSASTSVAYEASLSRMVSSQEEQRIAMADCRDEHVRKIKQDLDLMNDRRIRDVETRNQHRCARNQFSRVVHRVVVADIGIAH